MMSCFTKSIYSTMAMTVAGLLTLGMFSTGCSMSSSVSLGVGGNSSHHVAPVDESGKAVLINPVYYQHEGVRLVGRLAAPGKLPADKRVPAVLIIPEWWGLNDYAIMRGRKVAEMGYIALVADMYGHGKVTTKVEEAQAWSGELYGKPVMAQRAQAALDQLRKDPRVDPDKIIVMGYCFGGTATMELAYSGANFKGAVSFHGTPAPPTDEQTAKIKASLLILTGSADPMYDAKAREALAQSLQGTAVNWSMVIYGNAMHSFTNPGSNAYNIPGVGYNKDADEQSWTALKHFMKRVFSDPQG